jgi:hypothetical protein
LEGFKSVLRLTRLVNVLLFKQEASDPSSTITSAQAAAKKPRRTLYALIAILSAVVLVVSALLATQGGFCPSSHSRTEATPDYGASLPLQLNYAVGEQMVYKTKNIITNPSAAANSGSTNLTKTR